MTEIAGRDESAIGITRRALSLFFALLPGWILLALPLQIVSARVGQWVMGGREPLDPSLGFTLLLRVVILLFWNAGVWAVLAVPLVRATAAAEAGAPPNAWPYVLAPDPGRILRVAWTVVRLMVCVAASAIFLVIPGIYVGLRLSLAGVAVAAADDARSGLATSWALARGHLWYILGALVAVSVPVLVISSPFWIVASTTDNDLVDAASTAITSCLGEATTVALTLIYLRFRVSPAPIVPERAPVARSTSLFE